MKSSEAPRIRMASSGAFLVKIMSGERAPDNDARKCFQLLAKVESAEFKREDGKAFVSIMFTNGDHEDYDVTGNCYLMNEAGETVATFGAGSIPSNRLAA